MNAFGFLGKNPMRSAVLTLLFLAACREDEDFPGGVSAQFRGDYVGITGTKRFDQADIEAGIRPSSAILEMAEMLCSGPGARLISATSAVIDSRRVSYFFQCR
jgi:hypothetical protein